MDAVERNGYELIPHPVYSPDLAPSDYFLYQLEKGYPWTSFPVQRSRGGSWGVRDKDPGFFSSGLMALEHRWSKCIILEGNYIEKEEIDLTQK